MKYLVTIDKGGGLKDWQELETAGGFTDAAVAFLRQLAPKREDFPITVCVSDGKLRHPNGAPMVYHGITFEATGGRK